MQLNQDQDNSQSNQAKPGQYLTFMLKSQFYGVPIGTVREINRVTDITSIPQTASFVAGVMNLRGKVIPVVDLRLKFGLESTAHTRQTCVIVIEGEIGQVGMIVDSVSGVIDLNQEQIEPPPILGDETQLNFIMGMGKVENNVLILVDIVKAFSRDQFSQLEKLGQDTGRMAA